MSSKDAKYDVVGIGNAIVDVLSFCSDEFVAEQKLGKGSMTLVGDDQAAALYKKVGPSTECSGGSVANSLAGLAALGARCAFIGKVSDDQLGKIFAHDLRAVGVAFDTPPIEGQPATANCLIFVTPDAQRTMATYLGACGRVSEADIDENLVAASAITYIEGYLWDSENAKAAIRKSIKAAKKAGRKIAFTLSDTFCVERHRGEFLELIAGGVDILFANEAEIKSLYQQQDFNEAVKCAMGACAIIAITRSEKGSVILSGTTTDIVPARPVAKVIDTTGAGDLYAAGFLFGLSKGWSMQKCGDLGNRCAGRIIAQLGARSLTPLGDLLAA